MEVLIRQRSDSIIFLVQMQNYDVGRICRLVKKTHQIINNKLSDLNVNFGIGRFYNQLDKLHISLEEAEKALRVAQCERPSDGVCFFDDLGISSILLDIPHRVVLEKYYHDCFDPLLEYDRINNASLLNTLKTYPQENCNLTRASEKMFVHRNTLKYRINKIEELLGCDLNKFSDCSYYDVDFKIKNLLAI